MQFPVSFFNSLDPDVRAFVAASGATDIEKIKQLVGYVKSQGLWANVRCYPMKSAQNAGSGSVVYGLGGVTANNMTLINSPVWASEGVTFTAASSQHGTIEDWIENQTITVFVRLSQASATPSSSEAIVGQYAFGAANQRSWFLLQEGSLANDPIQLLRSSDGTSATIETAALLSAGSTADRTLIAQWINAGGRNLWINKTPQSLAVGNAQTNRLNANVAITLATSLNNTTPSNFGNFTAHALIFVRDAITDSQRENLTDLVNAL